MFSKLVVVHGFDYFQGRKGGNSLFLCFVTLPVLLFACLVISIREILPITKCLNVHKIIHNFELFS